MFNLLEGLPEILVITPNGCDLGASYASLKWGGAAWHRHMGFAECGVINGLNQGGVGEVIFRKSL
ncbi:MAG: hypothetical protein ACNA70_06650 [Brevefilum sp.]